MCSYITLWNAYEEGDIRRDAGLGNKLPMNDGTTTDYFFCKKFVDYSATTMQDEELTSPYYATQMYY